MKTERLDEIANGARPTQRELRAITTWRDEPKTTKHRRACAKRRKAQRERRLVARIVRKRK